MTTIACVDGIVAADTQMTGDYISYGSKLIEDEEKIYGLIGEVSYARVLVELLQSGASLSQCRIGLRESGIEFTDGTFAVVVISREETEALVIHSNLMSDVLVEPWALGSGGSFAMGAIFAGCNAEEAVDVASQLDPMTGGAIEKIEL